MTISSPTRTDQPAPAPGPQRAADQARTDTPSTRGLLHPATILTAIAVAVGVAARFWTTSALWLDEAITVDISHLPLGQIGPALRQDGHPPLSYWMLHGWMSLFGTSDLAVRSLSGVVSLIALPLMWAAGKRVGGRRVATAALLLLASSPFAIRYATETRMYSLLLVLGLAGYLAVVRALEAPRLGRLVLVTGLTTATLLTHYWGAWGVAVGAALVAARWWARPAQRGTCARVFGALAVGGLPFLWWLPSVAEQAAHTGTPWARSVEPFDATFDLLLDLGGGKWVVGRLLAPLLALTVLLALLARPIDRWRLDVDLRTVAGARPEIVLAGGTLLLGLGAAVASSSAFQPRYAAAAVPFVLLAAAVGIDRLPNRAVRVGVLSVMVVAGFAGSVRMATGTRTQANQVATVLHRRAQAGDVVGFCPDQLRPAVQRALGDQGGLIGRTFPGGSPPGRIDWVDYSQRIDAADPVAFAHRLLAQAGPGHTVWLVSAVGYRGFDTDCERIQAVLDRSRGTVEPAVARQASSYERDVLRRYPPP